MSISIYAALSALLCFNLFVVLLYFLRKRWGLLLGYRPWPLLVIVGLCFVRLLVPVETAHTVVLGSSHLLPLLQRLLKTSPFPPLTIGALLVMAASTVSLFLLLRFSRALYRECKLLEKLPRTANERLMRIFQSVRAQRPSKRGCALRLSAVHQQPCIFSLHRSVILLPEVLLHLDDEDLRFILQHEWQHHCDGDNQVKLGLELLRCLFWWNPFVYLLRRNVNQTLELKCDRAVVRTLCPRERLSYAEALTRVLKLSLQNSQMQERQSSMALYFTGAALAAREEKVEEDLLQRFEAVISSERGKRGAGLACIVLALALFFASFFFVLQPWTPPPPWHDNSDMLGASGAEQGTIVGTQEAYFLKNPDGSYSLYQDGKVIRTVEEKDLMRGPNSLFKVRE